MRWQHDAMSPVRWFFIIGGFVFLLAALFVRELSFDGADEAALTFLLIGVFWAGPQLLMMLFSQRSGR
jgi:Zn-dependent protease with chaperone function